LGFCLATLEQELALIQVGVQAAEPDEIGMRATLDQAPAIED
jgi:hypothetical protein